MEKHVLCLNSGSSSLKFALYRLGVSPGAVMHGAAKNIGQPQSSFSFETEDTAVHKDLPIPTHTHAVSKLLGALNLSPLPAPAACVHRIVHGGLALNQPVFITDTIKNELEGVARLAPLHIPNELAVVEAATRAFPKASQIACFDTAFHHRMPEIAKRLPIPHVLRDEGVQRYGFHGLSYEFVVAHLGTELGKRSIIAHLGNGCSMVALRDGAPQDTTMGLTPTGGLMMGTRSGELDPGVLFYLLRRSAQNERDSVGRVERMLNEESGLLGVSGRSRNMEELLGLESSDSRAREAIDLFSYCAIKNIGSLCAVLGGIDTLVFTGGIGENASAIRLRVCEGLGFLNIRIDPQANQTHNPILSRADSACAIRVIHTDENLMMARHASALLAT